jgi:class 3 adenylate cyclase/tetratricopeptide (TPR) repeat protein
VTVCTNCGRSNNDDARYCSACGWELATALTPRAERKAVSVLFCDLVDSTAQAERLDPEAVRRVLVPYFARAREEFERHGGTVEKFIGDAVVAFFGAPVAHEDDPERAVRAALALRDWVVEHAEFRVRVAVTTGEALVYSDVQPLSGEGLASGDVINTAARLQTAAEPNAVLVDETTFRATNDVIAYRRARPVAAKGKSAPVAVWDAIRPLAPVRPARPPRATFVGRANELAILEYALESARTERAVRLVTLVGVPGIGKSRLVHELSQTIQADGANVSWLEGRSLPYGAGITLWALGEIVKARCGILETDAADEAARKLRATVAAVLAEPSEAEWVLSHLRTLVLGADEQRAGDRQAEVFAAWRRFFEALAVQRALVLVLEDLHWADDTLLDFVEYLVESVVDVPLLAIATARPELRQRRPGWAASLQGAETLLLAPLSDAETTWLLSDLLERPLDNHELRTKLLEQARGNPLYAEEYGRLLAAGPDSATESAPEPLQAIIAARLDGLEIEEKTLLQDAAVLGTVFWGGGLGALAERDRWTVEQRLLGLERREFLRRERRSAVEGDDQYTFAHELIREVAYGTIPHGERARKHLRAVEWIESLGRTDDHVELLAHHCQRALDYTAGDDARLVERTRLALADAGDRSAALNAFARAAEFYAEAARLWPAENEPGRAQLVFRHASALYLTGSAEAERSLEAARSLLLQVEDLETAAESELLLAELWWLRGRGDQLDEHLERAMTLLDGRAPTAAKARVLASIARYRVIAGDLEEAIRVARDALALADQLDLAATQADALISLGTGRAGSDVAAGRADVERGVALALEANALAVAARGYNNLATISNDVGESIKLLVQSLQLYERVGDRERARFTRAHLAASMWEYGRWDDTLAIADVFLDECEAGHLHVQEAGARTIRAWIRLGRGNSEGALADTERALTLARDDQATEEVVEQLTYTVSLLVALGRIEQAREIADEILARGPTIVARHGSDLIFVADQIGRGDPVRDCLRAMQPRAGYRTIALELAMTGDLVRAAERAKEAGFRSTEAYIRTEAGRQLLEKGLHAQANEQFGQALAFYDSVGATKFIREIREAVATSRALVGLRVTP